MSLPAVIAALDNLRAAHEATFPANAAGLDSGLDSGRESLIWER
jgi:hypothetical protein